MGLTIPILILLGIIIYIGAVVFVGKCLQHPDPPSINKERNTTNE